MVKSKLIIPEHPYTVREQTVVDILKKYEDLNIKSFLNVGFHNWEDVRRHWWINICKENNIDWKILEIFEENVNNAIYYGCPENRIIFGDILDFNKYNNVDCLLFWHGPEHIEKKEFISRLSEIERKVNKLIIFGMPLGHEEQGIAYGNPYEVHVSDWVEKDWNELGYNVIPVYDNQKCPHISVYKIFNNE